MKIYGILSIVKDLPYIAFFHGCGYGIEYRHMHSIYIHFLAKLIVGIAKI